MNTYDITIRIPAPDIDSARALGNQMRLALPLRQLREAEMLTALVETELEPKPEPVVRHGFRIVYTGYHWVTESDYGRAQDKANAFAEKFCQMVNVGLAEDDTIDVMEVTRETEEEIDE